LPELPGGFERMTAKFKHTLADTVKDIRKGAVATARDINDNTKLAYDVKRKEIEETMIPKSAMETLTPEEVRSAEQFGLFVGFMVILMILFFIFWWFFGRIFA
jgi:hypothetical protein